jgi:hypothetical protein
MVTYVNRYVVTDNGAKSTVTDSINGEIVFTGPYLRAVSQAAELNRQASDYYNQKTTVISSGTIVKDDQAARTDRSNTQSPGSGTLIEQDGRVQTPPDTSGSSNVSRVPNNVDSGTNGPTRPITQTQGTPPGASQTSQGPILAPVTGSAAGATEATGERFANTRAPQPGGQIGVAAQSDDNVPSLGEIVVVGERPQGNTNATVASLNSINFDERLEPQDNILDQYASYTYQASLYLMDKISYQRMVATGEKNVSGAKLLVQSGGAPQASRSTGFDLDYYIDSIELKSFIAGKAVRLAHNVSEVKMTIIEPNGISFIRNIDAAVQEFLGGSVNAKRNFTSQIYLLVIKFYGYDEQGNLVRGGTANNQTSDPNAFVEKWYPLIFSKVNFKVANKAVEYEIEAKAPPYSVAASQKNATIPFNVELSGQTLKDILAGPLVYTAGQTAVSGGSNSNPAGKPNTSSGAFANTAEGAAVGVRLNVGRRKTSQATQASVRAIDNAIAATPPPKADAATSAKSTVRSGIMAALNEYQQKLKAAGTIQYADEYEIEFALDEMASAKITNPGLNLSATSMGKPKTAGDQKLPAKQSMDPNSRVESATAGMQVVQFIDTLIRNSTYIKDQQTLQVTENPAGVKPTGINIKNTAWYKITFHAQAKMDEYDEKRNCYAFKIKYIVSPYKISQLNSPYFKPPTFNGVHKQYKYWFTGENTQVLSYEETLNSLYYIVLTGGLNGISSSATPNNNVNELLQYSPQTASGQSTMGAEGKTLAPGADAADQLYSPSDLKEANLTIVGDPAWLQQGEAFNGIPKGSPYYFRAFLPDGTINFDSQQILFEIGYNAPADYSIETGLIEPGRGKLNTTAQADQANKPTYGTTQESRVYIAKEVRSHFARGKFTQDLKGSLMVYYPPGKGTGRPAPQDIPTASTQAAKAVVKAPAWSAKVRQPVPSSIPADPGTLGAALNALDVSYEGASIMAAAEEGAATRRANPGLRDAPIPVPGIPPSVPNSPLNPANRPLLNLNKNPPQVMKREP